MSDDLAQRYADVSGRVGEACQRAGRARASVTLVGVSKRQPLDRVQALLALGLCDLGENQIQAWRRRLDEVAEAPVRWHLVGPVQTNKAKYVAKTPPHLLHTVDRPELVAALDRRLAPDAQLRCLIQVNVDREAQKAGCAPEDLDALADIIAATPTLSLRGVMCIPRFGPAAQTRPAFAATRALGETIADRLEGPQLELSMGMSGDFEAAIEEGATLVRVGTALFGPRP